MSNRCINFIEAIEREAEHCKRCERAIRSEEVYAAACDEAIQHGVTLTQESSSYTLADNRHTVVFYAVTNVAFVQRVGTTRGEVVEKLPEVDVYDMTLMFCEGKFQ